MVSRYVLGNTSEIETTGKHEILEKLQAEVSPDGETANFTLQFSNQKPFICDIPLAQMGAIDSMVRGASNLMVNRARLTLDRGYTALLELCERAIRPRQVDCLIDPMTADRLFIVQVPDGPPVAYRMSVSDVSAAQRALAEAIARSMH